MEENSLDLNDKLHADIASRIGRANVATPVNTEQGMGIEYDADLDYLRITVGAYRDSLAFDLEDNARAILLYEPETYEIVGLELPSFKSKVASGQLQEEFWQLIAGLINQYGNTVYVATAETSERAGRAFRELVPA